LQARSDDVCAFLGRTETLVPTGSEADLVNIDEALAQLLP
jgi:hypothetical protein